MLWIVRIWWNILRSTHSNMDWLIIILEQCYHQQSEKTAGFCLIRFENKTKIRIEQVGYFMLCFFFGRTLDIYFRLLTLYTIDWLISLKNALFFFVHTGKCFPLWKMLTQADNCPRPNPLQFYSIFKRDFSGLQENPPQHDLRIVWKPLWTPFFWI